MMAIEPKPKTIDVDPGSEVARILEEAGETPVTLRLGGARYRLERERSIGVKPGADDIWANYDPERARESTLAAAGAWKDIDAEALKAYIYRGREEGSRSSGRS